MKLAISIWLICAVAGGLFSISRHVVAQKLPDDAPTAVTRRPPTDDEKKFTDEFAKRYPKRKRIKLSEFMPESRDFGIGLGGNGDFVDMGETRDEIIDRIVNDLTCKSDLVLIGRPSTKVAHLSADESFIYTEYKVRIEDVVLRINSKLPVGDVIKLAWPGGKIRLENRTIEATDFSYSQLRTDAIYLLFLSEVPDAKGYLPVGVESAYEINSDSMKPHSPGQIDKGEGLNKDNFVTKVQKAAPLCSRNK
jgi:hypothetical protein